MVLKLKRQKVKTDQVEPGRSTGNRAIEGPITPEKNQPRSLVMEAYHEALEKYGELFSKLAE